MLTASTSAKFLDEKKGDCVRRELRLGRDAFGPRKTARPRTATGNAAMACPGATADLPGNKGAGAPAQSAPPLGGREDGTLRVRSEANASRDAFNDNGEVG